MSDFSRYFRSETGLAQGRLKWLKAFVDLLFPPVCILCGVATVRNDPECLCGRCWLQIEYVQPPLCACCGGMLSGNPGHNHLCGPCRRNPPYFSLARSSIRYDQPVGRLLHRLKYHGDTTVLPALRRIIAHWPAELPGDFDLIVPVPLYVSRLRRRGFNQAEILAREYFPDRKKDIRSDLLRRRRDTGAQTSLSGAARRNNLRSAFQADDGGGVRGKRICLVDDVYTTGTTVNECAKALLDGGADEVRVLTLARVVMRH